MTQVKQGGGGGSREKIFRTVETAWNEHLTCEPNRELNAVVVKLGRGHSIAPKTISANAASASP